MSVTSTRAFVEIQKKLPERRREVHKAIAENPNSSIYDIADVLGSYLKILVNVSGETNIQNGPNTKITNKIVEIKNTIQSNLIPSFTKSNLRYWKYADEPEPVHPPIIMRFQLLPSVFFNKICSKSKRIQINSNPYPKKNPIFCFIILTLTSMTYMM